MDALVSQIDPLPPARWGGWGMGGGRISHYTLILKVAFTILTLASYLLVQAVLGRITCLKVRIN